jgi:predicted Zn-dependent protease
MLRPDDPRYAWTLAFYLQRSGDLRSAEATLDALLRAHPEYADAYGLLAEVYARQGRAAEAQAMIQRRPATAR